MAPIPLPIVAPAPLPLPALAPVLAPIPGPPAAAAPTPSPPPIPDPPQPLLNPVQLAERYAALHPLHNRFVSLYVHTFCLY